LPYQDVVVGQNTPDLSSASGRSRLRLCGGTHSFTSMAARENYDVAVQRIEAKTLARQGLHSQVIVARAAPSRM
jgi:hypothetical protein